MFIDRNLTKTLVINIWLISFVCATPVLDQKVTEETIQDVKPEFSNEESLRPNPLNEFTKILFNHKTEENQPDISESEPEYRPSFRPMFGMPFMKPMSGCCGGLNRRLPMVVEQGIEQSESKLPIAPEAQSEPDYSTSDIPLVKQGAPEPDSSAQPQPIDEPIIEDNSIDQQKDQPNASVDQTQEETKVDDQKQEPKSSEVAYSDNDSYDARKAVVAEETKVDESSPSIDKNEEQSENKAYNEENKTNDNDDDTAKYEDNENYDINGDENTINESPSY
ncbi:hypothetical protein DERF_003052 [Dermatophagoides farinae]|uniref:Uncharacterized protein n=1 Tax=Dermatophagoides farinae TaxID=6954 RepID=A0A922IGC7_DERFA|nr:hypothetical protein DERF_003052 [Dermatophagoides farinae]